MGATVCGLDGGCGLGATDRHLDARSLIHMVETLKPTLAGAVPTIWNDVMHYLEKDPDHDMSSLRLVACGGSAVPESLMRTFEDKHDVQIRQLWGMTETSPLATMAWPPPGTPDDQHWAFRITQGQPVCGVETDRRRRWPGAAQRRQRRWRGGGSRALDCWLVLRGRDESSSIPAGCAPVTSAASTSKASSP